MLKATGDIKLVQEWLGHSAIQTTSKVYAKVLTDHKVAALSAFEGRWDQPLNSAPSQIQDRNIIRDRGVKALTH